MQARYGAAAAPPLRGVTPDARRPDLRHIWIGESAGSCSASQILLT
jgi:hypothetical protein